MRRINLDYGLSPNLYKDRLKDPSRSMNWGELIDDKSIRPIQGEFV